MTKVLATNKETMLKWKTYLNAYQYEWTMEDKGNDYYLITIINN